MRVCIAQDLRQQETVEAQSAIVSGLLVALNAEDRTVPLFVPPWM
jgi:hypothetical protein